MMNRLGTRWLQTSPLSRSALVHLGLAVAVAPYMVGAAMGMALRPNLPPPFFNSFVGGGPRLYRPANQDFPNTNLPLEFWRYAPGGNVPLIRAPWGESVQPQPLFIAGFAFFNPYEVRNGNGERFSDWQLGRATEAVHGRRLSRQQYQDFLGGFFGSDRFINWQAPRLPEVLGQPRMAILTLAFYLCGCLALVLLHELLQSYRLHRAGRLPLRMVAALAGMPFLTAFVLDEYYLLRHSTAVAGPLFKMFLLHLSDRMPRNLYEVGAFSAVPAILLYFLVRRQFARSEMTVRLVRALPGITFPGAS
jgi:hypothetical protein